MPKQNSDQLMQLLNAFNAYSRSQTIANQDIFRTAYLDYIQQLTEDFRPPKKNTGMEFIQGDNIRDIYNTMENELRCCYTTEARIQHFPTAVLISLPYEYRKTPLRYTSSSQSSREDKNMIDHNIRSHTEASIAELMLFFTQSLVDQSLQIESPRSTSLPHEATAPQQVIDAVKDALTSQLGEPSDRNSNNYNNLRSQTALLKEKSDSKISYLALMQSASIFPIAAQFAHRLKYNTTLEPLELDNYQSSVQNEISRYYQEENIERALCVFSPVRGQVHYRKIPEAPEQISLNLS